MDPEPDRIPVLMQQCEHLASEIFAWRGRYTCEVEQHAATREEMRKLTLRLSHALATIENMERSWFWRARLVWVRLRGVFNPLKPLVWSYHLLDDPTETGTKRRHSS